MGSPGSVQPLHHKHPLSQHQQRVFSKDHRQTLEGDVHALVQPETTGHADQLGDATGYLLIVLEVPGRPQYCTFAQHQVAQLVWDSLQSLSQLSWQS